MKRVNSNAKQCSAGTVYLVGAGPGDAELITLKASRCISQADVIVYDRLVNKDLLTLKPAHCSLVYAGKRKHLHAMRQADINAALITHAQAGKVVVRLKGGDPFIFGRGGEEVDALAKAGIAWEVVPGITAASGAAAALSLPLTLRGQSQALTFVTAHRRDGELQIDWPLLLHSEQTVVVYMGLSLLTDISNELLRRGKAASTPFTVVSNATRPDQQLVQGTLTDIADLARQAELKSPALLIMGMPASRATNARYSAPATNALSVAPAW